MSGEELAGVPAELQMVARQWLDAGMTHDEVVVFAMTVTLWNRIVDMPNLHDNDADEYTDLLHKIQDKIASRPFFRATTSVESGT